MNITIYIDPECSKCQGACELLDLHHIKAEKIEYLTAAPGENELKELLRKLGMRAEQLVRKSEKLYQENFSDKHFTEEEWIIILHKNPILIERPIIVLGDQAIIARPPEKLLEFLDIRRS
jgi:arsenate reductase